MFLSAFTINSKLAMVPAQTPGAFGIDVETLLVNELGDGVVHVELNRPQHRNAMNWKFWNECKLVFETLAIEGDCRAIVLTARGKSFSAGLDLTDPHNRPQIAEDAARSGLKFITHTRTMQDALTAIELCLKPTIAVVHGACVGAGVDLLTAVDIRLCTEDAFFCIKEAAVGLAADVGTLARLPKIAGNQSIVRELALTARNCKSDEAKHLGLVSRVLTTWEEAFAEAKNIAGQISANSPVAVVGTKKNLNYARDHTVAESLDYVLTWNSAMIQTDDVMKAMAASMQKSKAAFSKL